MWARLRESGEAYTPQGSGRKRSAGAPSGGSASPEPSSKPKRDRKPKTSAERDSARPPASEDDEATAFDQMLDGFAEGLGGIKDLLAKALR